MGALAHLNCSHRAVRGPHRFLRGGMARPPSPSWRDDPSIKGPRSTPSCPVLAHPLCSSLQPRAPCPTSSSTGARAPKGKRGQGFLPGLGSWGSPKGPFLLQGACGRWGGSQLRVVLGPLPAAPCSLGSCTCARVFRASPSLRAFHRNPVRPHVSGGRQGQQQTSECKIDL